jgi:hypothetical protein
LRSEWTTWRPPYPSCIWILSSPTTIGSDRTLPDVRSKRTTRNGGPEPAKRATDPRAVLPQWDPSAWKVPRSGPTSQPKGRSTLSTRTGTLPGYLAEAGSQSDATAARRIGAGGGRRQCRECAGDPRDRSHMDTRRGIPPLPALLNTTPIRRPRLIDSEWRLPPTSRLLPVVALGHDRCMEQRLGRVQDPGGAYTTPRLLLPGDGPAREAPLLDSTLIPHHRSVGKSPLTDSDK